MAKLISLPNYTSKSGSLTVIENILSTSFERVFFIDDLSSFPRGRHKHKIASIVLVCLKGGCTVEIINPKHEIKQFKLHSSNVCLIIEPLEWHQMFDFQPETILLALSDKRYDPNDYIYEK